MLNKLVGLAVAGMLLNVQDIPGSGRGTLLLEDIVGFVGQSPKLMSVIADALPKDKEFATVTCVGQRISGAWEGLPGARVSPYACHLGDRWLEIKGEVRIYGPRGELYDLKDPVAVKNAKYISESNPTWAWLEKGPRD